jgi:hypothetical protein
MLGRWSVGRPERYSAAAGRVTPRSVMLSAPARLPAAGVFQALRALPTGPFGDRFEYPKYRSIGKAARIAATRGRCGVTIGPLIKGRLAPMDQVDLRLRTLTTLISGE